MRYILGCLLMSLSVLIFSDALAAESTISEADTKTVVQLFLKKLDRKSFLHFEDTPWEEAITMANAMTKLGMIIKPAWDETKTPITLDFNNVRISTVLDVLCEKVNLDWTIGQSGYRTIKILIAPKQEITEIRKKNPLSTKLIEEYKDQIKHESEAEQTKTAK